MSHLIMSDKLFLHSKQICALEFSIDSHYGNLVLGQFDLEHTVNT